MQKECATTATIDMAEKASQLNVSTLINLPMQEACAQIAIFHTTIKIRDKRQTIITDKISMS